MVLIEPPDSELPTVTTSHIISTIDEHASSVALILLPGIQYYTGQYFDIKTITAHAHSRGIIIGWDLAHAVGNVDVQLHDWDVDFAAWCNYKYINSGPGAIAALFVHERHGKVDIGADCVRFRPRLSGWWGGDKATRFEMGNRKSTPFLKIWRLGEMGIGAQEGSINPRLEVSMEWLYILPSITVTDTLSRLPPYPGGRRLPSWQSLCPGPNGPPRFLGDLRPNLHARHPRQIYRHNRLPPIPPPSRLHPDSHSIPHHHSLRSRRTRSPIKRAAKAGAIGRCDEGAGRERGSGG